MSTKIRLTRLLATHYTHTDLSAVERFYHDFGLIIGRRDGDKIYYRGFGDLPFIFIAEKSPNGEKEYAGAFWTVATRDDLVTASNLPKASPIQPFDGPGGGECVSLLDPVGTRITLVHGLALRSMSEQEADKPDDFILNSWDVKKRKGVPQRPPKGPSKVHKIGHYGLWIDMERFDSTVEWYMSHFALAYSDIVYHPKTGKDMMVFTRIDLGEEFVDHHALFFHGAHEPGTKSTADHTSFEVDNLDTQLTGHDFLVNQGWTNAWGIGRHVLGSQIFDYWFDSSGFVVEHYSDGDVMNNQNKPSRERANIDTSRTWGPNVTYAMMTGRPEDAEDKHEKTPLGIDRPSVKAG